MFNKRVKIKELLSWEPKDQQVTVMGWVRTFRNNQFVALNDGSTNSNLQVVIGLDQYDDAFLKRITTSSSLKVTGVIVPSLGKGQKLELKATEVEVMGDSDAEKYPLQPKKHSLEFLREKAHLRFRTNTFGSVFRVRHSLAYAVHKFFNDKGFVYMHTPVITASDAEGAGEMFKVTTLPFDKTPRNEDGSINFKEDFFGRATNLTVSGQLEGELGATAFGEIYTFGPTFRAENSNTARHLAEFWMIEPEMAFCDLEDNMNLAEEFIRYIIGHVLENNREDLDFLAQRLADEEKQKPQQERSEMGLIDKLEFVLNNNFERLTYTEAIQILKDSNHNKKKKFQYLIEDWGVDLQSEHERYLVEKHFKKPLSEKLIAAYLIGMYIPNTYFNTLQVCSDSLQTGCVCAWRSFQNMYIPPYVATEEQTAIVVNPLSWSKEQEYASAQLNKGAVLRNFNKVYYNVADAKINNGILWVNKPNFPGSFFLRMKNYHIADINFFYINIRENLRQRVAEFKKKTHL